MTLQVPRILRVKFYTITFTLITKDCRLLSSIVEYGLLALTGSNMHVGHALKISCEDAHPSDYEGTI